MEDAALQSSLAGYNEDKVSGQTGFLLLLLIASSACIELYREHNIGQLPAPKEHTI